MNAYATSEAIRTPDINQPRKGLVQDVFLSGSTGVLGGYICRLLLEADVRIHCLIRRKDRQQAEQALIEILRCYGASKQLLQRVITNVQIYLGDISLPNFGLDRDSILALAASVDSCIHAAANTALHYRYEDLYDINVLGTKHVLEFCEKMPTPRLIYVSTYSVIGEYFFARDKPFTEQDFDKAQKFEELGYQRSKFEAERLVRASEGLAWDIIRPGNIFGDSKTGTYPLNGRVDDSLFYDILKTFVETGTASYSPMHFDISPVDYIAKAICHLTLMSQGRQDTYHLTNPQNLTFEDVVRLLQDAGYMLNIIPSKTYIQRVFRNEITRKGRPYRSLTTTMAKHNAQLLLGTYSNVVDCTWTRKQLEPHGIYFPSIDSSIMRSYIDYGCKSGYIQLD